MGDVENIGEREVNPRSHSTQRADLEEKCSRNKVGWSTFQANRKGLYTEMGEKDGGQEM